jgi:hypothetical protein
LALKGGFYGILMIQEQGCTKHKTFTNSSNNCATNGLNKSSDKRNTWNGTALDSKYSYHKKRKTFWKLSDDITHIILLDFWKRQLFFSSLKCPDQF